MYIFVCVYRIAPELGRPTSVPLHWVDICLGYCRHLWLNFQSHWALLSHSPLEDHVLHKTMRSIHSVSNRSAGMISSRFPEDIFTKIQHNLQFYRYLPGRVTSPWDHTDPVYPSNSSVKGHLPGTDLIAPVSINPGLLQEVFFTGTL